MNRRGLLAAGGMSACLWALILLAALSLAGCAHKPVEPEVRIVEVKVPVQVPCTPEPVGETALTPRQALAALPLGEAVRRLLVEREGLTAERRELRAALQGCAAGS